MTLILAKKYDGGILLAGDSGASYGEDYSRSVHPPKVKLFTRDDGIGVGVGGSYRIISLLHQFIPPKIRSCPKDYGYSFVEAWKQFLENHDALDDRGFQSGGQIVIVRNHIFEITIDFGIIEHEEFAASGSSQYQAYAIWDYIKDTTSEENLKNPNFHKYSLEHIIKILSKHNNEICLPVHQVWLE